MDLTAKTSKQYVGELKAIDAERGTISALISTDSVDRDGDVILAAGWQLDNYRRNPVVLWAHRYDELPVAKALALEITDHGLLAMMEFADHQLARDVFDLYAGGFLRAFSVGFRAIEYGPRKDETSRGWEIKKAELLEFSCVPVPANQDALVLAAKAVKYCEPGRLRFIDGMTMLAATQLTGRPHYLDLPDAEQTRSADLEQPDDPAETQTRVDLTAALAGFCAVTDQLNKGVSQHG